MTAPKPVLELRPVEAPAPATPGACVYVLLPALDDLLGVPGFGRSDAICLPNGPRPFDAHSFFGAGARERRVLH